MMRKLKLQVQMTLDGFIGRKSGEMDWMVWNWDEELKKYVAELTEPVDCIVLGRKLAEGFIPHWAKVAADHNHSEHLAGKIFSDTLKVVFTRTMEESKWENTVLAHGEIIDEISKLKEQNGKDIIAYGGATFVSDLIKNSLIDELHLFINPVAIGYGLTIFREIETKQNFTLINSQSFDCGIVVLKYEPKSNAPMF